MSGRGRRIAGFVDEGSEIPAAAAHPKHEDVEERHSARREPGGGDPVHGIEQPPRRPG